MALVSLHVECTLTGLISLSVMEERELLQHQTERRVGASARGIIGSISERREILTCSYL